MDKKGHMWLGIRRCKALLDVMDDLINRGSASPAERAAVAYEYQVRMLVWRAVQEERAEKLIGILGVWHHYMTQKANLDYMWDHNQVTDAVYHEQGKKLLSDRKFMEAEKSRGRKSKR